jgi:hypothetical protein
VVGREGGEEEAEKVGCVGKPWGKASPIIPRLIIHAVWVSLMALETRGVGPDRPTTPARGGGAVNRLSGLGGGQVYNDTDTKAGF